MCIFSTMANNIGFIKSYAFVHISLNEAEPHFGHIIHFRQIVFRRVRINGGQQPAPLLHREHPDLREEIVPQKKRLFILLGHVELDCNLSRDILSGDR